MTMTRSTSTAAATVSSGWGPVQEESQPSHMLDGEHIDHMRQHVSVVMTNEMLAVKYILYAAWEMPVRPNEQLHPQGVQT